MFQSRNRGSFGFKPLATLRIGVAHESCFNLVIEVLLVSSLTNCRICLYVAFNLVIEVLLVSRLQLFGCYRRFNLVIEVLLVSVYSALNRHWILAQFQLVIEVLLVSQHRCRSLRHHRHNKFQSRNRGSFGFKGAPSEVLRYVLSVMVVPRATNLGTLGDDRNI